MKQKCIDCVERRRCRDNYASWIFFVIGLIATVSIRIVTVLMYLDPFYGKLAWYIGVGGFFLFFVYKFKINQFRSRIIAQKDLVEKLATQSPLTEEENQFLSNIMCSLSSKKENLNYLFIFALSAISLIVAVYFDFIR